MITFEILGRIQPKQRPRFSKGHTYTPKKTMDYEKHVKNSYPYDLMITGQLKIKIKLRMFVSLKNKAMLKIKPNFCKRNIKREKN
jgi:Holliday junction resolvase RusA-like endonuclease